MIRVQISGAGLGRIRAQLEQRGVRTRAVGNAVAAKLAAGNKQRAFAALDRFGRRMPPRKQPRRDGARGPVLAPHHTASRSVANFFARLTLSRFGWRIAAGWLNAPFLVYHAEGRVRGAPIRDVLGVTPQTQKECIALIREAATGRK